MRVTERGVVALIIAALAVGVLVGVLTADWVWVRADAVVRVITLGRIG